MNIYLDENLILLEKLKKYQTKLATDPTNFVYLQKVFYYNDLIGGASKEEKARIAKEKAEAKRNKAKENVLAKKEEANKLMENAYTTRDKEEETEEEVKDKIKIAEEAKAKAIEAKKNAEEAKNKAKKTKGPEKEEAVKVAKEAKAKAEEAMKEEKEAELALKKAKELEKIAKKEGNKATKLLENSTKEINKAEKVEKKKEEDFSKKYQEELKYRIFPKFENFYKNILNDEQVYYIKELYEYFKNKYHELSFFEYILNNEDVCGFSGNLHNIYFLILMKGDKIRLIEQYRPYDFGAGDEKTQQIQIGGYIINNNKIFIELIHENIYKLKNKISKIGNYELILFNEKKNNKIKIKINFNNKDHERELDLNLWSDNNFFIIPNKLEFAIKKKK